MLHVHYDMFLKSDPLRNKAGFVTIAETYIVALQLCCDDGDGWGRDSYS